MTWNLLQLLLEMSPMLWVMVGSFFFVVGVLWANVCWSSFRLRLMAAENEQLFLIAEREQAFEARERRNREAAAQDAPKQQERAAILRFDEGDELLSSSPQTDTERSSQ